MKRPAVRRRFRSSLWGVAVLTFVVMGLMVGADSVVTSQFRASLSTMESGYVPLLRYGPRVEREFAGIGRALQDAVAAQDRDALAACVARRDKFVRMLRNAPPLLDQAALRRLETTFLAWFGQAQSVSHRLVDGELTAEVTDEVRRLQKLQRDTRQDLRRTVTLGETELTAAFADIRALHATAAQRRLVFGIALVVVIAVIIIWLGRRATTAFNALQQGFATIGAGDFSHVVEVGGADELTDLAEHANQMARRIDDLHSRLATKQTDLEQANRELESFSYSVSHDLRAPLRAVDGFSQALLEDYQSKLDEKGQDYLHRIRRAAQTMGDLIDDLLSLSRIGRSTVSRTEVSLSAVAAKTAKTLEESDPSRRVTWRIAEDLRVQGDARLLTIAFQNLLGNAWKFTRKRADACIEVGATTSNGRSVFFVRDNGAGFDMNYSEKLFGAFQRLHHASDFEGTGIGLATVNRIIGKHGGSIWAEAEEDEGATFFFTLERSQSDERPRNTAG